MLVRDSAIEALGCEDGQFGFGHIEPRAVLGRMLPFEAFGDAPRLGGFEGVIERSLVVGIEIVLDEDNFVGAVEMNVGQIFQDTRIIDGGAAIGDFNVAPALQRCEQHEQIGRAIAPVFVIDPGGSTRYRRQGRARFGHELLA